MPTVETTIRLSIPRGGMSWESLEAQVAEVVRAAGPARGGLVAAAGALEGELLKDVPLRPEKRRSLDLLTRFGWMRLERWQVREQATGRYCYPLDQALGLGPRQHASPEVVAQAAALASRIPYRQAALLLGRWLGEAVDHRTLYPPMAEVQRAGVPVVAEEDEGQEAVFGRGQEAPRDPTEREIVVTEVDGTFLKAQREGTPAFEVSAKGGGVLYSGKEQESPTAKHRRYRLRERIRYGGVEGAEAFGERLFLAGEARLGLSHARHLLLVGDGAEWIEALAGQERWRATYPPQAGGT